MPGLWRQRHRSWQEYVWAPIFHPALVFCIVGAILTIGGQFSTAHPSFIDFVSKEIPFFTFASADSSTCSVFALSYLGEIYWQAMFLQISIKSWLGQGLQGLYTGQGLEVGDQLSLWRSTLSHAFVQYTRRGARASRGRQHLRLYRVHTFLTHHLWRILATKSGLCFFGFERLKVHFLLDAKRY